MRFLRPPQTRLCGALSRPLSIQPLKRIKVLNAALLREYATAPLTTEKKDEPTLAKIRNIGIIAHIDAGKTTTTERMLFYSGFTRRIGDVDEGSTVMDYLPAERARGITITSACITFPWADHTVNLIDTPGHADFTFEVERSIRVLDGAVTILDGVAGVEAQTEKVWRQAERYGIPRIIFVNKLDRVGGAFGRTVKEVAAKLGTWPLVCQIPYYEGARGEETFTGLVDVIGKKVFKWHLGTDGRDVEIHDYEWLEAMNPTLHAEAQKARAALVEALGQYDEKLVEIFLEKGDPDGIPDAEIKEAIRRQVLSGNGKVTPVFCGASFKNVGVQPLLDAVVDYLPSPEDRPPAEVSFEASDEKELMNAADSFLCALAFKVINDAKRGPMVFVRVYSGTLARGAMLFNTNLKTRERATRLLRMYADEAAEINSISTGHIGVIVGLKSTRTGDTLIMESHASASHPHQHHASKKKGKLPKASDAKAHSTMQLKPIVVPPPVFFASIEPASLSDEKGVEEALQILLREDPSLHVRVDEESGQTLLSGMGELHLEIARDRLVKELKAKCEMGKILISYRECITEALGNPIRKVYEREIAGKSMKAAVTAELFPIGHPYTTPDGQEFETILLPDNNKLTINLVPEPEVQKHRQHHQEPKPAIATPRNVDFLPITLPYSDLRSALLSGTQAGLARGPQLSYPMHSTHTVLTFRPEEDYFGPALSSTGALTSAARIAIVASMKAAHEAQATTIMEPLMDVAISVDESHVGAVVNDISGSRGGHVYSLDDASSSDSELATPQESSNMRDFDLNEIYFPVDADGRADKSSVGRRELQKVVRAKVPLKEMVGYLKHLRSITQGRGTFVMTVDEFVRVGAGRMKSIMGELGGGW